MKKYSIGTKIAMSFSLILVIMMTLSFLTIFNMNKIRSNNLWVHHTQEVVKNINLQLNSLLNAETGERGYILTGMDSYLEPYTAAIGKIKENSISIRQLTSDNNTQQENLNKLDELIPKKLDELAETIRLRKSLGQESSIKLILSGEGKKSMDEIRVVLNNMLNEESRLFDQRTQVTTLSEKKAQSPIIIALLIAFLVIIALTVYLTRIIAIPVKNISEIADQIASGNLNNEININRNDEIGRLADSFRKMQKTMLEKADHAKQISEGNLMIEVKPLSDKDTMGFSFRTMVSKLRTQLKDISEGINGLASSSSEIMAAVTQLASSSSETATSVSETTTTVEEVKQTAIVSNHKAKMVSDNSYKLAEISRDGNKAIANTIEGMNKIRQQMNAIASMVVRLSEQSQMIGEITASVNELAEQSNLLAVNAAIEAAKAGEQGKGFTVVAQEIKILANRSKEATAQVRNILRDIQKSISSAVMATEEGGKAVDEGLRLTNLSGGAIRSLTESIEEAANAAIQIAASSQQQLEGMDQVVTAMENIRESSIQAVASTQQSVESVNELQKVGQKLDELMKQYKLGK